MDDLKTYSNIITVSLDLSNWSETRKILTKTFKNVQIDGLVNNAGITICKKFEEFTEADYDKYEHCTVGYMLDDWLAPFSLKRIKKYEKTYSMFSKFY